VCNKIYKVTYLIFNCEYFNNLNGDENITGTNIMAGMGMGMETRRICTFICSSSPYSIEKVKDSPYPYPMWD